jgi:nitroimidazol reductase NimA-like FMN-containing flavoprotein (pyridoxamine 5'-phosphate oxidase superfamily)
MADFLDPGMTVLTERECWALMVRAEVGRLALCVGSRPEIFPVNFVADNRTVLIRTAEGTKLAAVSVNPQVAFEVDGFDTMSGVAWSVVVRGTAHVLEKLNEIYAAQELPLVPWDPAPKPIFIRIEPTTISGRRFAAARGLREI